VGVLANLLWYVGVPVSDEKLDSRVHYPPPAFDTDMPRGVRFVPTRAPGFRDWSCARRLWRSGV
jgi:hypothetical protein